MKQDVTMTTRRFNQIITKSDIAVAGVLLTTVVLLSLARSINYLLFHTLAEFIAIVVSLSMFTLTWASNRYLLNGYLVVLGGAYGAIGLVDVFHTLTFKGMNLFPGISANYPTQFWLTARYLEALALLLGPLVIEKRPRFAVVSAGFSILAAFGCGAVVFKWFPDTFIEGVGLTPFKVYSEYFIIAMILVGFILLQRSKKSFEPRTYYLLAISLGLAVVCEFCFTQYVNFYDFSNELGHYFRLLSVALAFIAIVLSGVRQPYELIFREINEHKQRLVEMNQKLAESEYLFKRAQCVSHTGSWHMEVAGNSLTWSEETYRIFDVAKNTPVSYADFLACVHPDDRVEVNAAWESAMTGKPYDITHRIVVGDKIRWVREQAELVFGADGQLRSGIGTVQDISELIHAEESLRESEFRYRSLFENMFEGVAYCRMFYERDIPHDFVYLEVNNVFEKLTGLKDVTGKKVSEIIPGIQKSNPELFQIYGRVALTGKSERFQTYVDGLGIWFSVVVYSYEKEHFVAVFDDITERKKAEELVRNMAFYDTLTGLPNRRMLEDRLLRAMAASKRSKRYGAVLFLDLDNFKPLNDTRGHHVGDLLLIEVAHRLVSCVRAVDTVARFGGDEFVVMLDDLDAGKAESTAQAGIVAEKIHIALAEPYLLSINQEDQAKTTIEHRCSSSIGVALFSYDEATMAGILNLADTAMYQAKNEGKNRIRFSYTEA